MQRPLVGKHEIERLDVGEDVCATKSEKAHSSGRSRVECCPQPEVKRRERHLILLANVEIQRPALAGPRE